MEGVIRCSLELVCRKPAMPHTTALVVQVVEISRQQRLNDVVGTVYEKRYELGVLRVEREVPRVLIR
jgi:hypothetical protein